MSVDAVSGRKIAGTSTASTANAKAPNADYETFVKLLIAQMKNQDPAEPMDSAQFVSQLASFSAVEQAIQTNTKLDQLLVNGPISQAEGYIGKYAGLEDNDGHKIEGKITAVTIYSDGLTARLDNGKEIVIGAGVTISDSLSGNSEDKNA